MKKVIILAALIFMVSTPIFAQDVKREGTMFVQQDTKKAVIGKNDTKTEYTYKAKDGKVYPIYLSKNGKAFIVRVSKKGNEYRQYLPKVTEQINKEK